MDIEVDEDVSLSEEAENFLQGKSVDEYFKQVMGLIKVCQKHSNELQGWKNYADYSGVQFTITKINSLLKNFITKIFSHQEIKLDINDFKLDEQFNIIREGTDSMLERVNADIDEASGVKKNSDAEIVDAVVTTIRGPVNQNTGREVVLLASRNVQKPQMFFSPKINNSSKDPFIPTLKEKPNSIKPLSVMLCLEPDGSEYFSHPYDYELQHWNPPDELLMKSKPIKPLPMTRTPFLLVEKQEALNEMVEELRKAKEIAVDLENHSFRSYQGLTCLIQISTRSKDYIVDPFPIRNHLSLLNEVFTDPKITKVFHGSDLDVLWLQRDCGVYVVNMFDTHQAAIVLEYPHRSLANLLYSFCSIAANKSYQRADWRIRPLPEDFIHYARQDSHYLLYIYDLMKNELIDKGNALNNLLCSTYNRSTEICMKRYEKRFIGPDSHLDMYRRSKKIFNGRQMYALQQIYQWRDKLARQHDESVDFVLPKHMMMQIAELLPKEMQGILACCNPIPSFVKTEQLTLHQIIRVAREQPLETVSTDGTEIQSNTLTQMVDSTDHVLTLESRFDFSLVEEDPDGLSTLLNPRETLLGDLFSQNAVEARLTDISTLFNEDAKIVKNLKAELNRFTDEYMNPYERFRIFVEHSRKEEKVSQQQQQEQKEQIDQEVDNSDQMRVDTIKDHFMNLTRGSTSSTSEEPESSLDLERMKRLAEHVSSLASEMTDSVPKSLRVKRESKNKGKKKRARNRAQKRKSSEIAESSEDVKKLKGDEAVDDAVVTEGGNDGMGDVTPFDYANANYSMFKGKNNYRPKKQNINQKFKGRSSNKQTGLRKSAIKSLTWGK